MTTQEEAKSARDASLPASWLGRAKPLVPNSLTLASILCGWYVIISALKGLQTLAKPDEAAAFFDHASQAIGLAIILDNLDGRIAE